MYTAGARGRPPTSRIRTARATKYVAGEERVTKITVSLTWHEYDLLRRNHLISALCSKQLQSAVANLEGVELSMTLAQLEDLTGCVAAESNHAKTRKQQAELGEICDSLEYSVYQAKRSGLG